VAIHVCDVAATRVREEWESKVGGCSVDEVNNARRVKENVRETSEVEFLAERYLC
jgi:hypothetical protein